MRKSSMPRRLTSIVAAAIIATLGGAAARAQSQPSGPPNALQGFSQNRNEPVKIDAASLEVRDKNKIATFTGNVHLVQGDTTLRCKVLVVYYDQDGTEAGAPVVKSSTPGPSGSSQIRKMIAKGGVVVVQKDQTATGDSAIYDLKSNTVTLVAPAGGTVAVTQGPNVMKGERLVVDLTTSVSHLEGRVSGLIIPNSTSNRGDTKATPDTKAAPRDVSKDAPKDAPKDGAKDAPKARAPTGLY